jgi:hypothetical protein
MLPPGWLQHILGIDNPAGRWYLFLSGAFFVLVLITGQAANAWIGARRHNCEVHGCWRLGRHAVEGTGHRVCRRHNPEGKITAEHVRERYHLYIGGKPGKG